jgi:hypothetical protein
MNLYPSENEIRPALVFDRIKNLELSAVRSEANFPDSYLAYLRNSKNVAIRSCILAGKTNFIFAMEEGTNENIRFSADYVLAGKNMHALKEMSSFEDFPTDIKYIIEDKEVFRGLSAQNLKHPLKCTLNINKRGSLQLCLLLLNNSHKPEKVIVRYEGVSQEYTISWNEWGWAPLTLLNEYLADRKVDFEIVQDNPDADIKISRVYLRYQDVKKTD